MATTVPLIENALRTSPSGERRLRDLRDELEEQYGVLRPWFYHVVRSSPLFEQFRKREEFHVRLACGS